MTTCYCGATDCPSCHPENVLRLPRRGYVDQSDYEEHLIQQHVEQRLEQISDDWECSKTTSGVDVLMGLIYEPGDYQLEASVIAAAHAGDLEGAKAAADKLLGNLAHIEARNRVEKMIETLARSAA
ncbi:hypothetical protein [Chitinolyticbacter meiyuanensis]|uniref:hypothetical protein n=1 Tax=Chitinolyticbacter meiyuanensis TaxID=682798 RepID=UPI0011E5F7A8|nr:hypothetical protein [Chitinolyticbacter meiyuanensis]